MPASNAKPLTALLRDLHKFRLMGAGDPAISSIVYDSRRAGPGSLFVAMRGHRDDGTVYVADAISRGAAAVVAATKPLSEVPVPVVLVPDSRKALAELAWTFYDHPQRALICTAVTGTNGKTTVATQLRSVLEFAGHRAGLAGTLGINYGNIHFEVTAHHAGVGGPCRSFRLDARPGNYASSHGSHLYRRGSGTNMGHTLSRGGVHQFDARPSGLSSHRRSLSRGEAEDSFASSPPRAYP